MFKDLGEIMPIYCHIDSKFAHDSSVRTTVTVCILLACICTHQVLFASSINTNQLSLDTVKNHTCAVCCQLGGNNSVYTVVKATI